MPYPTRPTPSSTTTHEMPFAAPAVKEASGAPAANPPPSSAAILKLLNVLNVKFLDGLGRDATDYILATTRYGA